MTYLVMSILTCYVSFPFIIWNGISALILIITQTSVSSGISFSFINKMLDSRNQTKNPRDTYNNNV